MITEHRDHYQNYADLLRCHDALLETAKAIADALMRIALVPPRSGDVIQQAVKAVTKDLRAAIAAGKGRPV